MSPLSKYILTFFGGVALTLFLFVNLPGTISEYEINEVSGMETTLRFQADEEIDPDEFVGLSSEEIIKKLAFLTDQQASALRVIFSSRIPTQIEFNRNEGNKSHSYSFYVKNGFGSSPTMSFSSSSVRVIESIEEVSPPPND